MLLRSNSSLLNQSNLIIEAEKRHIVQIYIGNIIFSTSKYEIRGGAISWENKPQVMGCEYSCDGKTFSKHSRIFQLKLSQTYLYHLSAWYMDAIQYDKEKHLDVPMLNMTHTFGWRHSAIILLQFTVSLEEVWASFMTNFSFFVSLLLKYLSISTY